MSANTEEQIQTLEKERVVIDKKLQELRFKNNETKKAVDNLLVKKCKEEIKEFQKYKTFTLDQKIVLEVDQYIELELEVGDLASDAFKFYNYSELDINDVQEDFGSAGNILIDKNVVKPDFASPKIKTPKEVKDFFSKFKTAKNNLLKKIKIVAKELEIDELEAMDTVMDEI